MFVCLFVVAVMQELLYSIVKQLKPLVCNMERYHYTRTEQVDMLLIFGECRRNARAACALYAERYPDRHHPAANYFNRIERQFRTEPDNLPNNNQREHFVISEETEADILAYTELNPTSSTREVASVSGISHQSVWRILRKHGFHSFKYQLHQHLYDNDNERRLDFCNWILENHSNDNNFHYKILYSDETRFTNNGMFNRNNLRYWARENPRLVRQGNFQERFGFNCWMGILGTRIVGPMFFEGQLTAERYLGFLQNQIEEGLDELPLNARNQMYFQQDGAPAHNARIVAQYLNNRFGDNWIGTSGPVMWPARSPDLAVLDFFVFPYLKNIVYSTPPTTLRDLQNRVTAAIATISPQQLHNVMREVIERARLCQDVEGGHFEQHT